MNRTVKRIFNLKTITKTLLSLAMVFAVAVALWYVAPLPVKALTIEFPSVPATGTIGTSYTFQVKVNVETQDLLPVNSIDLKIRSKADGSYTALAVSLPLPITL